MVARTTMRGRLMTTRNRGGATSIVKRWFGILEATMDGYSCMGCTLVFIVVCRGKEVVYGGYWPRKPSFTVSISYTSCRFKAMKMNTQLANLLFVSLLAKLLLVSLLN
ncbi:hypothetical protein L1987_70730 [Smallanthus sonchifolius]|uniref:Uncharacterized protein n=1 Tax=Smallanthus sonchifolius TaxID=185202 RepID=A0ACB9ART5_9ASTR|nr:hypothetical protein L1987_70730 [Smallanthus sonchifolius]